MAPLFVGSLPKSEALAGLMKPAAEKAGARFFDAAALIPFPGEPDCIHFSPDNHAASGKALAEEVKKILK